MTDRCQHLSAVRVDTPEGRVCQACVDRGDTWVHLRWCRTCGHVGCCDDSRNRHATAHFHATQHPIMSSLEPGERWSWCYVDQIPMEID